MLELAFQVDRGSEVPLPRQLAEYLAALVAAGRIGPGARLPATRDLAAQLGVARHTVAAAYDELAARGLAAAYVGRGTFVVATAHGPRGSAVGGGRDAARSLSSRLEGASRADGSGAPAAGSAPREFGWAGLLSRRARELRVPRGLGAEVSGAVRFDFRGGRVDPESLPAADLRWAFARALRSRAALRELAAHGDPYGWPPLRREISRRLTERGIACSAADVAVTTGLQQAIDLAARALLDPGDAVALEQPGYFGAALAFRGRGADLLGVDVDEAGLRTDHLARLLRVRRVKLVYVTPAAQSPTGARLSPARRDELLALADEHQVPVFEDDYDSELRWEAGPLAALKARDGAGQVLYAGTFSKILFPALRVGYVVAARPLLDRLVTLRAFSDLGTGAVEQAALASLLATRGLERHLQRMRRRYAARRAALLEALAAEMPAEARWTEPRGGHLVWVTLREGIDPQRLRLAARARGVAYTGGETCFVDGRGANHLALAFTALDEAALGDGVRALAAALNEAEPAARAAARPTAEARRPARPARPSATGRRARREEARCDDSN